tara:strand:- start:1427 stop:2041 length:615 start_codon:yes stop_codon:yes gene_type:complete
MNILPYAEARSLIQEGDVLLFRGKGLISWLIKRYGSGVHSHSAIAHWDDDNLECVEFREFRGGRAVSLKTQIETHPNNIDVFRAANVVQYGEERFEFTNETAKEVSNIMINLSGLPYGWKNICKLIKHYLPFWRLAKQNVKDDDPTKVFVCSTAVAYAYRKAYLDPVPYLADSAVMPSDLARSSLFRYQFTIQKDWYRNYLYDE